MMIPFTDPTTKAEEAYNIAHKKCRCSVERAIGVLKSRFRCMCKQNGGAIQFDVEIACPIIAACIILHNYCRKRNIKQDIDIDIQEEIENDNYNRQQSSPFSNGDVVLGYEARNRIVTEFFS